MSGYEDVLHTNDNEFADVDFDLAYDSPSTPLSSPKENMDSKKRSRKLLFDESAALEETNDSPVTPLPSPKENIDSKKRPRKLLFDEAAASEDTEAVISDVELSEDESDVDTSAADLAAASKATLEAFHYPVHVPLTEGGLADLQLSYVAGSLAVAESEVVAQGVSVVLKDLVPQYLAYIDRLKQGPSDKKEGVEYLSRLLQLLESLTNSMRNLAVADPLTQWNEAALSVLLALDTARESSKAL
jgi:hypothetical protein